MARKGVKIFVSSDQKTYNNVTDVTEKDAIGRIPNIGW